MVINFFMKPRFHLSNISDKLSKISNSSLDQLILYGRSNRLQSLNTFQTSNSVSVCLRKKTVGFNPFLINSLAIIRVSYIR